MISNIVNVVADVIHVFKIILVCELLLGVQRCKDIRRYIFVGVAAGIVSEIIYCLPVSTIGDLITIILYISMVYICVKLIFTIRKLTAVIISIELIVITSMLDILSQVLLDIFCSLLGFEQLILDNIIQSILSLVFVMIMLYIIKRKYRTNMSVSDIKKSIIFLIIVCADAIVALTIVLVFKRDMIKEHETIFLLVAMSVLIGMFIQLGAVILLQKSNDIYIERDELQKRYLNEQKKHYEYLEAKEEETKKFRHDLRNHMLMLEHLRREDKVAFEEYVERINLAIDDFGTHISINNGIADAVINKYYNEMQSKGIELQVKGTLPKNCSIDAYDLCIVFSNILSNAMEAVEKINDKKIYLECRYTDKEIFIKEKNSYLYTGQFTGEQYVTWKKDKNAHGYGLKNIDDTVKRNGGIVKFETTNDKFCVSIMMKI